MARPKLEAGTDTVRVQIVAPQTLISAIDEWRATKRPIPSRAEAVRILCARGLELEAYDEFDLTEYLAQKRSK